MTAGIVNLAVPLSTMFAGEFLILAGAFQQGWGWAVAGATGIVLAAMYTLRLISAVLHQDVGPAVSEAALDLRGVELAIVVPLVLCLVGLSAWPNLISGHAFGGGKAIVEAAPALEQAIPEPTIVSLSRRVDKLGVSEPEIRRCVPPSCMVLQSGSLPLRFRTVGK
jgi:NADH-quinone oxidoreductase subunit M